MDAGGRSEDVRDWHRPVGRAGFVAKGAIYLLVGALSLAVAVDGSGAGRESKGQAGALRELATITPGKGLLGLLAIGFAAYAVYRLTEVFVGAANEEGRSETLERVASVGRTVLYAGLAVTAVRILAEAGGRSGASEATSTVFDLPAGPALVFAAGLVVIGVGLYQLYAGFSTDFEDDLDTARMGEALRRVVLSLGIAGHLARSIVFCLIGAFLLKAAIEHDSSEAIGLDGALQEVAEQSYGTVLLVGVAAGLMLYGVFVLIEARYRRL